MSRDPLIPVDLVGIIQTNLDSQRREHDGLLHASSDLIGSIRHSQLRMGQAPQKPEPMVSQIRTTTGWMWHNHIHQLLVDSGVPVMSEVNLTPWMPEGWSGTADWVFWSPQHDAWVLGDLKTTKGESMKFKTSQGMSEEHQWQLSAYYYALLNMGLKMVKGFGILYLPMNSVMGEDVEPMIIEAEPIDKDVLNHRMTVVKDAVDRYMDDGELAPEMERVQKLFWCGAKKPLQWDVTLVPHWLTMFCPFDDSVCACDKQGNTKIGHWLAYLDGAEQCDYIPRKGYEDIEPLVAPTEAEIKKRLR